VNHKVHLCMSGCLTLKLSLSWKTVICSLSACALALPSTLSPSGEIGIVERSTGEAGFAFSLVEAVAVAAAMFAVVCVLELCMRGCGEVEGKKVWEVLSSTSVLRLDEVNWKE
jgi:transketolase N-terminal domain/subunit